MTIKHDTKTLEVQVQQHRFVFIGGLHRSGTSVIFRCLREHPLISGFRNTGVPEDEGQHLQSIYRPAFAYGGPGKFGFSPEAHLTDNSALATKDNQLRLFAEWQIYWDLKKPVLLEKSPPNLICTRFLQKLFPYSYFVIVTRHPIAVSYATQKWSRTPLPELIEHWLVCHKKFEQDKRHIKRLLVLKYEDFVKQPGLALQNIYSFIGLPNYPNQIEVHSDTNKKYLEKWLMCQENVLSRDHIKASYVRLQYQEEIAAFDYNVESEIFFNTLY